jgi:hypothetical protein
MSKNSEALNRDLYELLRSRGYKPKMLSTSGQATPVPEEAAVFQFNFIKDGEDYGKVSITIDGDKKLIVYYGDEVANSPDTNSSGTQYSDSWTSFVRLLSSWRFRNGLRKFDLENEDHLESDMARREHMRKQESISEGYYPMGKKASYSDAIPTVKMVIQHSRQIEEGEQRYRNVARIFLENQDGERFLAPTTRPGIAKVYARHIAEGGKPHDDRWNHIGSLCEEYQKMAGFVRATRGGQFNESAQKLVESGIAHYNSLRESLSKLTGHRGYNMYFESWTPPLMEDDSDTASINELFVQETLDPRIESVMPILSKLHKQVSEMAEVSELAEWADSLLEGGDGGEASEETDGDTGADAGEPGGEDAPEDNLSEGDGGQEALNPVGIPESEEVTEGAMDELHAELSDIVANEDYDALYDLFTANTPAGKFVQDMYNDVVIDSGLHPDDDFERIQEIVFDRLADEFGQEVDEGLDANQKRVGQLGPTEKVKNNNIGKLVGANENFINTDAQAVVTEEDLEEMDSEGYTGSRDSDVSHGPDKTAKMTTAKKMAQAGLNILNKQMNKVQDRKTGEWYNPEEKFNQLKNSPEFQAQMKRMATKEDVLEGQEDLDAILRIIRK